MFKKRKKATMPGEGQPQAMTARPAEAARAESARAQTQHARPSPFERLRRRGPQVDTSARQTQRQSAPAHAEKKRRAPNRPVSEVISKPREPWLLPALTRSLQRVFEKAEQRRAREEARRAEAENTLLGNFTARMQKVFDELHKEIDERERVLDQKIKRADQIHQREVQRVRWVSIPAGIVAVIALGYLFYIVNVMENAMTSMSHNMSDMSSNMTEITANTGSMSRDLSHLNGNVANMTQNVGQLTGSVGHMSNSVGHMTRDVGAMSHAVTPAAQSMGPMMGMMRNFMPF